MRSSFPSRGVCHLHHLARLFYGLNLDVDQADVGMEIEMEMGKDMI